MSGEYEARLADVASGPWRGQSELARSRLQTMTAVDAARYFRFHDVAITDSDEIAFRESYDQALEELQILELAVSSGYLPLDVVRPQATTQLRELLAQSAARRYVEVYDFVPVRFLAARLDIDIFDNPVTPPPVNPKAGLRFATFLALHSELAISPTIERFTQLLDDYRFYALIDAPFFLSHLESPASPLTDEQQRMLQTLCLGFLEFLQILGDLFLQLDSNERPLYGCMYAYWLSHFFGLRRATSGYEPRAVSFQKVDVRALLACTGDVPAADVEEERLRARIAILGETWRATRQLVESVAGDS